MREVVPDCVEAMAGPGPDDRSNPFPGLRPFTMDEAHLFFGRSEQIEELLATLDRSRFVAVLGASGSGKSSLVRAGLLPALHAGYAARAGSWVIATFRPGSDPVRNLAAALASGDVLGEPDGDVALAADRIEASLRRSSLGLADLARHSARLAGARLLVVVDQFEELFRFREETTTEMSQGAAAFVALLLGAAGDSDAPVDVIITMRSDFLGDCSQYRDLPETINHGLYLVPRMTRVQLGQAITAPVAVGEGAISHRLVQRVLNDAGADPDTLPLVQHALMRTWDVWRDAAGMATGPLDLRHYNQVGGLEHALSRHANEAYAKLAPGRERTTAETVFKLLTELGPDGREVRRPRQLTLLAEVAGLKDDPAAVTEVIRHFAGPGRSFVVCSPDGSVDISHESLIRQWDRLAEWVAREARDGSTFAALAEQAEGYNRRVRGRWRFRRQRSLLRGRELADAAAWWARARPTAAWAARYHAGFGAADAFLRRSRLWARVRALALVAVGATLATLALVAYVSRQEVRRQERQGVSRQLAAQSLASLGSAPDEALLLSLEAFRIAPTVEAQGALFTSLSEHPRLVRYVPSHDDRVLSVAFSADGELMASGSEDGAVRIHDAATGEELAHLAFHDRPVYGTAFTTIGGRRVLATSDDGGQLRVWDADTGEPYVDEVVLAHDKRIRTLAFDPSDPGRLASGGADGAIRLWRVDGAAISRERELDGHGEAEVRSVAFSPDGALLASGGEDAIVRLWDPDTGALVGDELDGHTDVVRAVAFSPNLVNRRLVSGGHDNTLVLWQWDETGGRRLVDLANNELPPLRGHDQRIYGLAFRGDGRVVASASRDNTVRFWDADTGAPLLDRWGRDVAPLTAHQGAVRAVAYNPVPHPFGPGSWMLATASNDQTVAVWDTERQHAVLATTLPVATGGVPEDEIGAHDVNGVVAHPTEAVVVWGSVAGTLTRADLTEPGAPELEALPGHDGDVRALEYSDDGTLLASSSSADCAVRIWDDRAGEPRREPLAGAHTSPVADVDFSPDGEALVTGGVDGRVVLWDLAAGTPELLAGPSLVGGACEATDEQALRVLGLTFTPDGQWLVASIIDETYLVWPWRDGRPGEVTEVDDYIVPQAFGRVGVTFGGDEIEVWDLPNGWSPLEDPGIPSGRFFAAAPQSLTVVGERVVIANLDGTLQLWDLNEQKPVGPPVDTGLELRAIAAVAGQDAVVAAGGLANLAYWDLNAATWAGAVCPIANRSFSAEEWNRLAPEQEYRESCPAP